MTSRKTQLERRLRTIKFLEKINDGKIAELNKEAISLSSMIQELETELASLKGDSPKIEKAALNAKISKPIIVGTTIHENMATGFAVDIKSIMKQQKEFNKMINYPRYAPDLPKPLSK